MASDAEARLRAAQGYAELGMNDAAWRELEAIGELLTHALTRMVREARY